MSGKADSIAPRADPLKMERFTTTLLGGHKDAACEVPFHPGTLWGLPTAGLWRGRRGYRVRGRVNGVAFESAVVPRSRRFWLLIGEETRKRARAGIGESVIVDIEPLGGAFKRSSLPARLPARGGSGKKRPA